MQKSDRQRILLMEDEPLIRMILCDLVEEQGLEVVGPASTCSEALALLTKNDVHAALLDAHVNGERCDAVAYQLDELGVPWALVTGFDPQQLNEHFSGVPVIAKPFVGDDLAKALTDLLPKRTQGVELAG